MAGPVKNKNGVTAGCKSLVWQMAGTENKHIALKANYGLVYQPFNASGWGCELLKDYNLSVYGIPAGKVYSMVETTRGTRL